MDLTAHLERGWNNFVRFIGPSVLLTVVYLLVSFFSFGLLAPVATTGYFQSLLLAQRDGRTPEMKDLFSAMNLFLPLFLFGLVILIAVLLGLLLFILPGLALMFIITFATVYLLPLLTDRKMGFMQALRASWDMAVAPPMGEHVVITVIYLALLSLGGSIAFGILFTQPLATFILLSFYQDRLRLLE